MTWHSPSGSVDFQPGRSTHWVSERTGNPLIGDHTMRYLMFISHSADVRIESAPPDFFGKMDAFIREAFASGALKATGGLLNNADAQRIALKGGKLTTTDGPFTEAKELVGGYAIVEVATAREAREIANRFMDLHRTGWPGFTGTSEIRPMEYYEPPK